MKLALQSVNVAVPGTVLYKGREVSTSIRKRPVAGPVRLGADRLEGDEQADKVHHGGSDKAVCAYFFDHYPYWENAFGAPLEPGAFGENFTLAGGSERDVHIGDTFRLGEALLQVTQPRVPCFKLAARHERPTLEREVIDAGYTGFYFRVLQPGYAAAGDALVRETNHPLSVTIEEANRVMHREPGDMDGLKRLLAVDALADSWRSQLSSRLPSSP